MRECVLGCGIRFVDTMGLILEVGVLELGVRPRECRRYFQGEGVGGEQSAGWDGM